MVPKRFLIEAENLVHLASHPLLLSMATFAVSGSWVEFFPLPLKRTTEDDQLTPIKPHKGFANAVVTLVSSQPPPSCGLHALGTSINHKFPLDGSMSGCILQVKSVLFFGTRVFSHSGGLEVLFDLVLFDL